MEDDGNGTKEEERYREEARKRKKHWGVVIGRGEAVCIFTYNGDQFVNC